MIKLLILDVDGILTNGKKTYNKDGEVTSKEFCDKDWTAIKLFRASGIEVCFLTGDPFNAKIAEKRRIDCIINRENGIHKDKSEFLPELMRKYKCQPNEIAFLGDDYFDIGLLKKVGYPFCPSDSPLEVRLSSGTLENKGGNNLIMEFYELCIERCYVITDHFDKLMNNVYKLDVMEKF